LSGFDDPEAQKRLHEHDTVDPALIDKETGKPKKVFVPILKPENFGENMTIDDKNIGGEGTPSSPTRTPERSLPSS
jgi:hypothetical protein